MKHLRAGRERRASGQACAPLRIGLIGLVVATLLPWTDTASAENPAECPGSTTNLGVRFHEGPCWITANTRWANGTLIQRGNLIVGPGALLELWNLTLLFDPGAEQEWRLFVDGGRFEVTGGTISSNTTFHWRLETSSAPEGHVQLDGVNVSRAGARGGGPYSGFALLGGNAHRFRRLAVTDSSTGPDWHHALISTWSPGITDLRVEDSTFRNTGRVLQMVAPTAPPTEIEFRGNTIEAFNGSGGVGAIYGFNLDIVGNRIDTGANQGIWLAFGGGPGWPRPEFHHRIAGNTITSRSMALYVSGVSGYLIEENTFHGRVFVDGSGSDFSHNTISDVDEHEPVVTFRQNGTVRHNTWRNVTLREQAALVDRGGFGNVTFFANTFELRCEGVNCMAIQVINVGEEEGPTAPGFPTVEVSWNNVTWTNLPEGTKSVTLDNEFSVRLYVHNNTQRLADASPMGARVTTSILAGGVRDSLFENNTMRGPQEFGIYHFIYEDANDTFQYNLFQDAGYAGIFQAGGSVIRHNRAEDAAAGWWICPPRPCAGSSTNPANLTFFDNALRFREGSGNVTRMSWPDFRNNTFIGRGTQWSNESRVAEPVHGGWLFFANETIERVSWSNDSGTRRVGMTVGAMEYYSEDPDFGAEGTSRLSVSGTIDPMGSVNGGTVLWRLDPRGASDLTVTSAGPLGIAVSGFRPLTRYRILAWEIATGRWIVAGFTTDRHGMGAAAVDAQSPVLIRIFPWSPFSPRDAVAESPAVGLPQSPIGADCRPEGFDGPWPAPRIAARDDSCHPYT